MSYIARVMREVRQGPAAFVLLFLGLAATWMGRSSPLLLVGGSAVSLVLFWLVRSISTVRSTAEQRAQARIRELRESEERFRFMADAALEGIVVMYQGEILDANRQFAAMYGYELPQALGAFTLSFVAPEERERVARYLASGYQEPYETIGLRKDGTTLDIAVHGREFPYQGRIARVTVVRDITERKRAERRETARFAVTRALSESVSGEPWGPRLLQALCEHLGWEIGEIWLVDQEAAVLRFETLWHLPDFEIPGFEDVARGTVFGRGEGIMGKVWADSEPAWFVDVPAAVVELRAPVMTGLGIRSSLGFPVRRDGEVVGVLGFFTRSFRQPESELLEMMADVGRQIGQFLERRKAEEDLRESEERYRAFFDNSFDAVLIVSRTREVLAVNREACRIFGRTEAEIRAAGLRGLVDYSDTRAADAEAMVSGTGRGRAELSFLRKDGTRFPGETSAALFLAKDGSRQVCVIVRDITERKRAEEALSRYAEDLARSHRELQSLIEQMGEGVLAVDQKERLLQVNPAARRMLSLPAPLEPNTLANPAIPPDLASALRGCVLSDALAQVKEVFHHNGRELRALVSPLEMGAGRHWGAVALLQDVTADQQLEQMRERFVANVSHELRGPLATLSAGVEAMHDGLIPKESQQRYLKAILAEISRMRRLTNDLLELSRLDAGMIQIPQEDFALSPLCEGLLEKMGPRAAASGISLGMDCGHLRVVANYDRVEQVIVTFLDNALRHTTSTGRILLFAREEQGRARIGVEDTGSGIPAEHLPHIWERFYKVDFARTRTPDAGTGLGLAIARQLVELMGGEVSVTSRPGHGSTFSFTLPLSGS